MKDKLILGSIKVEQGFMKNLELQTIYTCDNLALLKALPSNSIQLILTDPPFETKSVKKSKAWDSQVQGLQYYDSMGGGLWSYSKFLRDRIEQVHRVLKDTGTFCLHLDYRAVHYAKLVCDEVFGQGDVDRGAKHLINEIIWCYGSGGVSKRHFSKKHDTILCYAKNPKKYAFNVDIVREDYKEKCKVKHKIVNGKKYLRKNPLGRVPFDWFEMPILTNTAKERIGYPTQKPLALYERFIKAFSNKNDVVMDIFAGCGTTLEASQNLGRNWIGCDASPDASKTIRKRLTEKNILFKEGSLEKMSLKELIASAPRKFEEECVTLLGGVVTPYVNDGGVDGRLAIDGTPIQVKQSENIGRPVVDSFYKHLKKHGRGIIVALSFNRGCRDERDRLAMQEGIELKLITPKQIISFESPISKKAS